MGNYSNIRRMGKVMDNTSFSTIIIWISCTPYSSGEYLYKYHTN
jgi:hypothetical protein